MNKFEAVLLISPDVSNTQIDKEIEKFDKILTSENGKIFNSEDWGLRELSYNIGNFKKAFYKFFQIELEGNKIEVLKKKS